MRVSQSDLVQSFYLHYNLPDVFMDFRFFVVVFFFEWNTFFQKYTAVNYYYCSSCSYCYGCIVIFPDCLWFIGYFSMTIVSELQPKSNCERVFFCSFLFLGRAIILSSLFLLL